MTHVTERETLVHLQDQIKLAVERCGNLGVMAARGPTYSLFRAEIKAIENCCRQVAYYREDARWLQIGLQMEHVHQVMGRWLRQHERRVALFNKLADNLRALAKTAHDLEVKATGRLGMILPVPQRVDRTEGRPVQVVTPGGIIIPDGVTVSHVA